MERHLLIETVLVWTFEDEDTALRRAKWSSILLPVLFLVSGGLQFLCYWINNKYCHPYRNKIYAKNRKYFQTHCKGQSFNIYTFYMLIVIKSGLGYWASMLMKGKKNKRVKRYLSLKLQLNHFNHIHHQHPKHHKNNHQHHLHNPEHPSQQPVHKNHHLNHQQNQHPHQHQNQPRNNLWNRSLPKSYTETPSAPTYRNKI